MLEEGFGVEQGEGGAAGEQAGEEGCQVRRSEATPRDLFAAAASRASEPSDNVGTERARRRFTSTHRLVATVASQLSSGVRSLNFSSNEGRFPGCRTPPDHRSARMSSVSVALAPRVRRMPNKGPWH